MKTLLLAAALALLSTAALATPVLRGEVTVNAAIVTVGDMFDGSGDLAETALFRAPAPGTTGLVPLADVQRAAALVGLQSFDNVGYTRVRVVRASTMVDATLLGRLVGDELARRGIVTGGVTADTRFDTPNLAFNAEAVAAPATLADLRYSPDGTFSARFLIAGTDQPVDLGGRVELLVEAPHLLASQPAGAILTAADFATGPVPLATADAGNFAAIDQLVGKQLTRQSRAGMMLKASDVAEPTVVSRNQLVTVMLQAGAMTLTVKGQALGNAAAGEPVEVLNTVTKKILHGVALSSGTVTISTSLTVAGL